MHPLAGRLPPRRRCTLSGAHRRPLQPRKRCAYSPRTGKLTMFGAIMTLALATMPGPVTASDMGGVIGHAGQGCSFCIVNNAGLFALILGEAAVGEVALSENLVIDRSINTTLRTGRSLPEVNQCFGGRGKAPETPSPTRSPPVTGSGNGTRPPAPDRLPADARGDACGRARCGVSRPRSLGRGLSPRLPVPSRCPTRRSAEGWTPTPGARSAQTVGFRTSSAAARTRVTARRRRENGLVSLHGRACEDSTLGMTRLFLENGPRPRVRGWPLF